MLKTFKGKLLLGTLAITSIANLMLTFYISKNLNLNLQDTIKQDMNNIKIMGVNNVGFNSKLLGPGEIDNIPWKTISEINNNFKCFVAMANEHGELIDYSGKLYYEEPMLNIIKESENEKSLLKLNRKDNYYLATYNYPIYIDGEFYRNLVVQNNYKDDFNNKNRTLMYIIIGQGLLLIMLFFAINHMINRITDPLKRLTTDMKLFAEGKDVKNIVISSGDEVGELSNSFNNMREEIEGQMNVIVKEKERVLELQKLSKEFFNNATHELKTPITAISGYAQVLKENLENQDEFTERALERTVIECEKMTALVQNILDISRGSLKNEEKANVNLKLVVEDILKGVEVRANRLNIDIKINLEEVNIVVIKSEVEQILINLIDNAIKYTKENLIEIDLVKVENEIVFRTKNTVSTIPTDIKEKLLEPFVKYNISNPYEKSFITSSGLGLYLCNEIAKRNEFMLNYEIIDEYIIFELRIIYRN